MFTSGHFLTTKCFVELVRAALACTDVDQRKDGDHSLRTGAATTAVERGFEDSVIKTLGRWESVAYLQYVRLSQEQLTAYDGVLAAL